jgi:nucleoside 2-deoxyribosyltransferase
MLNIYLASSFKNQAFLREIRTKIEAMGHKVTSTWLDEHDEDKVECAVKDIHDIDRGDTLIVWPDNLVEKTAGKFVELGYALGTRKAVFMVAPETTTCIFKHLPQIHHVSTWQDMLGILEAFAENSKYNYAL